MSTLQKRIAEIEALQTELLNSNMQLSKKIRRILNIMPYGGAIHNLHAYDYNVDEVVKSLCTLAKVLIMHSEEVNKDTEELTKLKRQIDALKDLFKSD